MKKFSVSLLFVVFILANLSAQDRSIFLNDNNIRLRDRPSIDSNILLVAKQDSALSLNRNLSPVDDGKSDFVWISVRIGTQTGWMYGQFISFADRPAELKHGRISNFAESLVQLPGSDKPIFIGMKTSELEMALGKPARMTYDETDNTFTWTYLDHPEVLIMVGKQFGRISHIILKSSHARLSSGVAIGDDLEEILETNPQLVKEHGTYHVEIDSLNRTENFSSTAFIFPSSDGKRVSSIQIGNPKY